MYLDGSSFVKAFVVALLVGQTVAAPMPNPAVGASDAALAARDPQFGSGFMAGVGLYDRVKSKILGKGKGKRDLDALEARDLDALVARDPQFGSGFMAGVDLYDRVKGKILGKGKGKGKRDLDALEARDLDAIVARDLNAIVARNLDAIVARDPQFGSGFMAGVDLYDRVKSKILGKGKGKGKRDLAEDADESAELEARHVELEARFLPEKFKLGRKLVDKYQEKFGSGKRDLSDVLEARDAEDAESAEEEAELEARDVEEDADSTAQLEARFLPEKFKLGRKLVDKYQDKFGSGKRDLSDVLEAREVEDSESAGEEFADEFADESAEEAAEEAAEESSEEAN